MVREMRIAKGAARFQWRKEARQKQNLRRNGGGGKGKGSRAGSFSFPNPTVTCSKASVLSHPSHFPVLLSHLTCATCNGTAPSRSAPPHHEARSHWRTHFSSPTGDTVFSDEFFHLTTNSLLRSPSATSLRQVRIASRIHSSRSPSHGGVIFPFAVVPSAWSFQASSAMVTPTSLDSDRPISLASCAFKVF